MKLSSKLAILGGVLAGMGAVALTMLKRKQNEEIYHEAELKAMDELDQMMEQSDECEGCTCAEECASIQDEHTEEASESTAEETPAEASAAEEATTEASEAAETAEEKTGE